MSTFPRLLLTTAIATSLVPTLGSAQVYVVHEGETARWASLAQTPYEAAPSAGAATGASAGGIGAGGLLAGGLAIAGALALAASGGGGGDTPSVSDPTPDPDPDPTPDPLPEPDPEPREFYETMEYFRNWGLDSMNVSARYANGGTGQNTRVAVFDTGADVYHLDLADNVNTELSYSYYEKADSSDVTDTNGHGTQMAGIIGAAKNDIAGQGVAYDTELIIFQGLGYDTTRTMSLTESWADATWRSIDAGAVAINHSWVFTNSSGQAYTIDQFSNRSDLEIFFGSSAMAALQGAADNNLVMLYATGNDGLDQPSSQAGMAYYFPELSDYVLGVAAIDDTDQIADFSNRCGVAMDTCISAPGVDIYSTYPDDQVAYGSGTSPATAHVSGAVAVLSSNFPELTGAEITTILKETARDLGAPGVDEIYGHGALDLETAVAPAGTISFQTTSVLGAGSVPVSQSHFAAPAGLQSSLAQAFASETVMVTDGYDRGYSAPLTSFLGSGINTARARTRLDRFTHGVSSLRSVTADGSDLSYSLSGGEALPDGPFAALFQDAGSVAFTTSLGNTTVEIASAFSHDGDSLSGSYLSLGAGHDFGGVQLEGRIGSTREEDGFLGAQVSGAFGDLQSQTLFTSLGGEMDIGTSQALTLQATMGISEFSGSNMLREGQDLRSRALRVGYKRDNFAKAGDSLRFSAGQDLSLDGGTMTIVLPTALGASEGGVRSDDVTLASKDIDLGSSTAPVDLELAYETPVLGGRLALGAHWQPDTSGSELFSLGYQIRF